MIGYYAVKDVNGISHEVFWLPGYFYSKGIDKEFEHKWDYDSVDFMDRMFGDGNLKSILEDSDWIIEEVEIDNRDATGVFEKSLNLNESRRMRDFYTWRWIDNILEYVLCNVDLSFPYDKFDCWENGEKPFGEAWY